MDGQFVWMLQGRVDAHGEALDQANEVVDSADPGGEVVDTMVTGDMVKGVMVTDPSEVAIGALVVAAAGTGVEDTLQVATEIIGVREDMLTALEPTAMDTTAMLHTSKHLPDSRSSLGWLYFKDALLKKNVHVLLLTLVL